MLTHNQIQQHNKQNGNQQARSPTATNTGEHDDLMDFLSAPMPHLGSLSHAGLSNDSSGGGGGNVDDIKSTRKERVSPRRASKRGSFKFKKGAGPIDDPNFAPPPILPADLKLKPSYELNAEHEPNYKALPKHDKIRHAGHIMTRFSAVSLLTKKWKQNYWILYGDCLYFFRSKEDFEEWLLNPFLSKEQRAALVKRYLNFNDDDAQKFQVDKVGMKYYRKGGMMYHFKLDKLYIRGPATSLHLVAAFSSMNENDVMELHTLLLAMLGKGHFDPKNRAVFSETHSAYSGGYAYSTGYSSTASANF